MKKWKLSVPKKPAIAPTIILSKSSIIAIDCFKWIKLELI